MRKIIIGLLFFSACIIISCSESNKTSDAQEEDCNKPIQDPNDVKPMAQMMRTMAIYCDSMRLKINKNETVDSVQFPLMPFWNAEPTDSSVLETLFFNNAKNFAASYRLLMSNKENQKENYTAVINNCVNCHSIYCSGPLKRIRKLTLDYKEE
jgi:hypothetical protein